MNDSKSYDGLLVSTHTNIIIIIIMPILNHLGHRSNHNHLLVFSVLPVPNVAKFSNS